VNSNEREVDPHPGLLPPAGEGETGFDPIDFPPPERTTPAKLYLISPQEVGGTFPERLKAALEPGLATAFQLRVKDIEEHELARLAEPLQRICGDANVAFIVNDSMALAKRIGADGVHLGQSDGDVREARALLGPSAQIGKTCHDSRHLAMEAGEAGADYVALGAFYPTTTKPSDYRPDPSILSWWSRLFEIPCVAIGGITPGNAKPLVDAGADFLAVCQAVWGKEDPAAAVAAFEGVLSGSSGRPST
jgi:thiamine-phosphate pyrophosphorylase